MWIWWERTIFAALSTKPDSKVNLMARELRKQFLDAVVENVLSNDNEIKPIDQP